MPGSSRLAFHRVTEPEHARATSPLCGLGELHPFSVLVLPRVRCRDLLGRVGRATTGPRQRIWLCPRCDWWGWTLKICCGPHVPVILTGHLDLRLPLQQGPHPVPYNTAVEASVGAVQAGDHIPAGQIRQPVNKTGRAGYRGQPGVRVTFLELRAPGSS